MRKLPTRRTSMALTVAICSLFGVLASPTANAAPTPAPITDPARARALAATIGTDRTGGVYYNDSGQLVVAVTDEAAARTIRAGGGTAEIVKYSTAALNSVHTALDDRIAETDPIPNTAWGVDPSTNQVTVSIVGSISAADEKRLMAFVAGYGDEVRVEKLPGAIRDTAYESYGGIGIVSADSPAACTLGFNVRNSAGQKYFVTAGHCADTANDLFWHREQGNIYFGKRTEWYDSGAKEQKDYAVVKYNEDDNTDVAAYGSVKAAGATSEITDSRYPDDGDLSRRAGATSSDLDGVVLVPSETMTNTNGVVRKNMIKTSHCALPGDSGGPLWSGTYALGITSATTTPDSASCNSVQSNYRTWFQPVHWVLGHYGLRAF